MSPDPSNRPAAAIGTEVFHVLAIAVAALVFYAIGTGM